MAVQVKARGSDTIVAPRWIAYRSEDTPWKHLRAGLDLKQFTTSWRGSELGFNIYLAKLSPEFKNPRHRHPFDQVRINLSGTASYGPNQLQRQGEVGWFPEGVLYGPTLAETDELIQLTVQFPGPARILYPSPEEQAEATAELNRRPHPPTTGPSDPYDTMLGEILGRKLVYPKGRTDGHVIFRDTMPSGRFNQGARIKHLGYMTEVGPNLKMVQLASGTATNAQPRPWFEFRTVVAGSVSVDDKTYPALSGFYFDADCKRPTLTAGAAGAVMLVIQIARSAAQPLPFADV